MELTEQEAKFLFTVLLKADPMELAQETASIKQKLMMILQKPAVLEAE